MGAIWALILLLMVFLELEISHFFMEVIPDFVFYVASLKQWQELKQAKSNQMYEHTTIVYSFKNLLFVTLNFMHTVKKKKNFKFRRSEDTNIFCQNYQGNLQILFLGWQ